MTHYIRTNHVIRDPIRDTSTHYESINKAKKASRKLQTSGNTVSKAIKRTHRLHYTTAKR